MNIKHLWITLICIMAFSPCDNDTCPKGSVAIKDVEGNVVDCFNPVEVHNFEE
ncbi:hypothetical protein [Flagellimonas nanhaiensis]|uniref:hypothetical protein n=1 Tax=Flagellimonas nanhaiensis TaxID=2292706 RepID=UPI0015F2964A|nr:hypothetical protein [Allomuricauda nanhaiensis]